MKNGAYVFLLESGEREFPIRYALWSTLKFHSYSHSYFESGIPTYNCIVWFVLVAVPYK